MALGFILGLALTAHSQEQAPVPAVDTTDRQQVIDLYQNYYLPSNNADPGWTGDVGTGVAGTLSEDYLTAILRRINYYRAMSGVSSEIVFGAAEDAACQQAALMFAAQNDISHTPGTDWLFYTSAAAQAAADANIRLDSTGDEGPGAVDRFMAEVEPNNYYVGHRRWFIFPGEGEMGAGAVPPSATVPGTSAIWVLNYTWPRPATPAWTSWPPAGYVPANLVFARWSFSYPDADFSGAQISVSKEGAPLTLQVEPLEGESGGGATSFLGDNTIVWEMPADVVSLTDDATYTVHLANVLIGGVPQEFDYLVTSIDAEVAAPLVGLSEINATATVPIAHRAGPSKGKIELRRTGDLSQPLTVSYQAGGNGVPDEDYHALTGTITFKAGLPIARIRVVPSASPESKGRKTVEVTLLPGETYTLGEAIDATVTIKK